MLGRRVSDVTTARINVLVLATGATMELEPTRQLSLSLEMDAIDDVTDFGCDPLNSADRLRPDARYFLKDVEQKRKQRVANVQSGLSVNSLVWLTEFHKRDDK